jgi:hypothetical protein
MKSLQTTTVKLTNAFAELHLKANKAACRYFAGEYGKAAINLRNLIRESNKALLEVHAASKLKSSSLAVKKRPVKKHSKRRLIRKRIAKIAK